MANEPKLDRDNLCIRLLTKERDPLPILRIMVNKYRTSMEW
jgi:hypothetical protein